MKRIKKSLLLILITAMILFDGSGMGRMFTYADTDGSGSELTQQEIKAETVREHLYEKEPVIKDGKEVKVKTKARKYVERFWDAFAGRDADLSKYEMDLKVTVSGKLPEDTTAQVRYFIPDNQDTYIEQGMCYFELTLYDANGEVYIPEDPVTVTIGGKDIVREIQSDNAPLLYCYEENQERSEKYSKKYKKDFYAADVNVYKSSYADKKLLQYEPYDKYKEYKKGSDAVRYDNVKPKNGLVVYEDSIDFKYDFQNGPANNEELGNSKDAEVAQSAHFALTSQMTEREFTAQAGSEDGKTDGAQVTVTGHLDKDVQLKVKEIKKDDKDYNDCVEKTAAEMDKAPEQLESVSAYDIKLIDPVTGNEFEPDSNVKVDIVPEDSPSDKKAEDVQVVKITDDELPVFTLAQAMKEQTVTASDGNKYKVTAKYDATSGIPADAELSVKELKGSEYKKYFKKTAKALGTEHLSFARFFDISLIGSDGKEYQPNDNVSVTIRLMKDQAEAPAKGEKTEYNVVHFGKETEVLDAKTKGDAVSFKTGSFSVFAVADDQGQLKDEDGNPVHIRTYRFFAPDDTGDYKEYGIKTDQGGNVVPQKIKNGEKPVIPIVQPPESMQGAVFAGWYENIGEVGEEILDTEPYDFNNIPEITEDEEIHLCAVFKKSVNVVFHEQYDESLDSYPVITTKKAEIINGQSSEPVDISKVTAKYFDKNGNNATPEFEFFGWSYTKVQIPGTGISDVIEGSTITVEGETHLYPVYKSVKWLSFNSGPTGSGATYYSNLGIKDEAWLDSLSEYVPTRPGYTFDGWYTDNTNYDVKIADSAGNLIANAGDESAGVRVTGGKLVLTKNATLYAKWTAGNVNYSVVVWKQKYDDNEKYEFYSCDVRSAEAGTDVELDESYKSMDLGPGSYTFNSSKSNTSRTISGDGTTVFNVYYDKGAEYTPSGSYKLTLVDKTGSGKEDGVTENVAYGSSIKDIVEDYITPGTKEGYEFGWYADPECTQNLFRSGDDYKMPDHNLTIYAGWEKIWYLVKIDPNGGALYSYQDGDPELKGSGSTWFWEEYDGEPIAEYTHVTRDYVPSDYGNYYYVDQSREYYGYPDTYVSGESGDRKTYYTTNASEATNLQTYRLQPGAYQYAGWYEVKDGNETPYEFGQKVTHDTTLKLHWKKAGEYNIEYNPVVTSGGQTLEGTMDDGSSAGIDENDYADRASIELTRSAVAPEGYEFTGWKVRDDSSGKVYRTGEVFELPAEYAVTMGDKKTVFLDAVYERATTSKVVYNGNGGTLNETVEDEEAYYGKPDDATVDPRYSVSTDKTYITVSNLQNNGKFKLSTGVCFTREGCEFTGWNTKDDGSGKHYDPGALCGIDAEEPVVLYAEWKVKVYFDKNDNAAVWNEAEWGTPKDGGYEGNEDGRMYYSEGEKYYTLAAVNSKLSDISITPALSGSRFKQWSSSQDGSSGVFNDKITEETTLYAQWTTSALVPIHVFTFDSSDSEITDRDSWRNEKKAEILAGSPKTVSSICSEYVTVPDELKNGYDYTNAYIGTSMDAALAGGTNPVKELSADGSGNVTVKYQNGSTEPLESNQALYLVYSPKISSATVKINYVKESSGGSLNKVKGSEDGTTVSADKVTYEFSEMDINSSFVPNQLNSATVAQTQEITVSKKDLEIDQSSNKKFNMPARLDDGINKLDLVYSKIATGDKNANNISSLDSDPGKKLHLQIRDGQIMWSYDGEEWKPFSGGDGYTPTLYAVYRERGHELQITKEITKDTTVKDYKTFDVTISSNAITEESYSAEGTGHNRVEATPASDGQPGTIEITVKDESDIIISGLASGTYTVSETANENYTLTAKVGKIGEEPVPTGVTDNTTVDPFTLNEDKLVALSNEPEYICRIYDENDSQYHKFFTLDEAMEYTSSSMDGHSTIEMLVDYVMPAKDALEVGAGCDVTFTTAPAGVYHGKGTYATITRENAFARGAMADVAEDGSLTLKNITFDGENKPVSSEMVQSEGELIIESNTTFKNANQSGEGGALYISGGSLNMSGGRFENNTASKGGAIYVAPNSKNAVDINISGGTIGANGNGNNANKGGAIYYAGGGTLNVSGGSISYNTSDTGGGGIYAENGTIEITGGSISNNNSEKGNGGGIYAESAVVNVKNNASITNNSALSGGAVYYSVSSSFNMSGGVISGNTATNGDGGGVRLEAGTANLTGGQIINNTATKGNGGAVYGGSATVNLSAGTYSGNTAINGSAVYIASGIGSFTGGTIRSNTSTEGGAVGVGSESAKLIFDNSPIIKENPYGNSSSDKYANVYLDQDTEGIISTGTINDSAWVGIYVPGSYSADLFENRGQAGSEFGTYSSNYTDKKVLQGFKNDRQPSLSAITRSASKTLMWGKTIEVEVRYLQSYANGMPPAAAGTTKYTNTSYYLPASKNTVSEVAEDLRKNYTINIPETAMFGGAFRRGDTAFSEFITDVNWDSGNDDGTEGWKCVRRYKDPSTGEYHKDTFSRLVFYYSEPAYISIENNTDYELEIGSLSVMGQNAINGTTLTDAGYGYVYAVNGAIRNQLLPITENDLKLQKMRSIMLVFPGACGQNYEMTGVYKNVPGGANIPVRINGQSYGSVPPDKYSGFTLGTAGDKDIHNTPILPSATGGSVNIIFGGEKPICKIERKPGVPSTAGDTIAATHTKADGTVQYCFSTLNDAKQFAVNHSLTTVKIEMLVDYLIPASDTLDVPAGYDITMTTAVGSGDGYYYEGSRATISRASGNTNNSFLTSAGGGSTTLRVENLKFDGKSLVGNPQRGIVSTERCVVYIDNSEFVNCWAHNGGGVFVRKDSADGKLVRNDVNLSVTNTVFSSCRSTVATDKLGGGAIWTDVRKNTTITDPEKQGLYIYNCRFEDCRAVAQAGAVFHRIDGNIDSVTTVKKCQFMRCESKAAGAVESDAKNINLIDSTFKDCMATERNGGGANFYSLNSATPSQDCTVTAKGCTFNNCRSGGTSGTVYYGGGLRSTAKTTYVTDCTFINCASKQGGGLGISNTNATIAEIHGCTAEGCTSSVKGAGVYCTAKSFTIDDKVSETAKKTVKIANNIADNSGGGICHERSNKDGTITISDAEISGNSSTKQTGGGISLSGIKTASLTDTSILNNAAKGNGGGLCIVPYANNNDDPNTYNLTLDHAGVRENRSETNGGGIYVNAKLTLKNGTKIKDNNVATAAANCAGVFLVNGRSLTVGDANAEGTDTSSVIENFTDSSVASNIRITDNGGKNTADAVYVNCDLSGRIGVVNANAKGTQFGSSRIDNPKGFGYAEGAQVFRADDGSLVGVTDRNDPRKLIWMGDIICKITDEQGHLLYLDNDGGDPAVFDALDVGDNNVKNTSTAFSYLRNDDPVLYYKDGTRYTKKDYCVKMLESYKQKKYISHQNDNNTKTITLTTAGKTDADYPYRGKAGTPATITRTTELGINNMITARYHLILKNIILDGGSTVGAPRGAKTRILEASASNSEVTLGSKAVLQNSDVAGDGGGIYADSTAKIKIEGGEIKNCKAQNGGAINKKGNSKVTFSSGDITACSATGSGGGIYYTYKSGAADLNMGGGSIARCSAPNGGGIFLENNAVLNMTGGSIKNCTATTKGGGIAVGGNASKLYFQDRVTVSGNKLNDEDCNVELNYDTNKVINTKGLDKRAYIGVYVPDGSTLYEKHGVQGKPFGEFTNANNLQRFVNDRNGYKGGIQPGGLANTVYWVEGSRNVVLQKVGYAGGNIDGPLEGATFTVYYSDKTTVASDTSGNRLENLTSNKSGEFFAGELYYGTYCIKETSVPSGSGYSKPADDYYFVVKVSKDKVEIENNGRAKRDN